MVDNTDLKSVGDSRAGSSPVARTNYANNKKKANVLGMPYGTANGKLKKNLMFNLVCKLNLNICFHCNTEINKVEEFSIEHKIPWLNSDKPVELFFNLENISFSHLKCNVDAGAKLPKLYANNKLKNQAKHQRRKSRPNTYARILENKRKGYHRRKNNNL